MTSTLHGRKLVRVFRITAMLVAAIAGVILILLIISWPFTRTSAIHSLERVSSSKVRIGHFQDVFFPHPGYIAKDVIFTRNGGSGGHPLATVAKITCHASWFALLSFTHRIKWMRLRQLHVWAPVRTASNRQGGKRPKAQAQDSPSEAAHRSRSSHKGTVKTTVTELIADGAIFDVAMRPGAPAWRLTFPRLRAGNLASGKPIIFQAVVESSRLPSELKVKGTLGPLSPSGSSQAPVFGRFDLVHAKLNRFHGVSASVESKGSFSGTLKHLGLRGTANIQHLEIAKDRRPLSAGVSFSLTVDAVSDDANIESATFRFLNTALVAHGSVSGKNRKTLSLRIETQHAPIQDLLQLVKNQPSLDGALTFHAHILVPVANRFSLSKLDADGEFDITGARFNKPGPEEKVTRFSQRAEGKKNTTAKVGGRTARTAWDLKGDVRVRDGMVHFSKASFRVPGAAAHGAGTFNLRTKAVNLKGRLATHANISNFAGGIKSVLLLPLDPLFKRKHAGAVIPFKITGTYGHLHFRTSL